MAPKRILVAASEVLGGDELLDELTQHLGANGDTEVMIVSPALVRSRLDLAAGDVDDDISDAQRRLEASISALREKGIQANGEVGESDPGLAIRDGVARFAPDEVVIVAHPSERANWQERDLVERAERELTIPTRYIEVESQGDTPAVKHVQDVPVHGERTAKERARAEFETDYLPPLSRRDRLALVLGPAGVVALWLMAANCQGDIFHDYGADNAGCIALLTISILTTIWVAIHVPLVLLLRSGNYRGGLAAFMAKTILYGMPVALVAGAILMIAA
jgi:hypothetical protein